MIASSFFGALLVFAFGAPQRVAATTATSHEGRIVGGSATTIGVHPFQVALLDKGGVFCGGSIIAPQLILTAAHCSDASWPTRDLKVRAGSTEHASGGQLVAVSQFVPHENYSRSTLDNDIAIVVLVQPLVYTKRVQPVQLSSGEETVLRTGTPLIVSGWGLHSESAEVLPDRLHHAVVRVIAPRTCAASYSPVFTVTERMLCAGYPSGGRDSCQGDSGGPLTYRVGGVTKQLGIVSWGIGCGLDGYPGVYTRVSAFRTWIDETIARLAH